MPRIKKFSPKSKFRGNKYVKINEDGTKDPRMLDTKKISTSRKKLQCLQGISSQSACGERHSFGNIVVNLSMLSDFISKNTVCRICGGDVSLGENQSLRKGIVSHLTLSCKKCSAVATTMTSKMANNNLYENNIRLVYGLRSIGKGMEAGKLLCALLDIPNPPAKFMTYNNIIGTAVAEVCNISMKEAAEEALNESDDSESGDICACFDGSWQKRGHTSLNGVVTCTSFDTGKVLDVEILSKYCKTCGSGTEKQDGHYCHKNYTGPSGGMEVAGVLRIFNRSVANRGVRYTQYLGDGDSKAFDRVCAEQPYGPNVTISKLECIGHVQKRMGSRLRRLLKEKSKIVLEDGKKLGGKGRLTNVEIDRLQNYYGLAIRRNVENLENMKKAVWAIYFHKLSTNENPVHSLCPNDPDTWCKYRRSDRYDHKHSLPEAVMNEIKPIFRDLCKDTLLKKCLHGKTQNLNECVNSVIWTRLPKTVFVQITTLKFGVYDAILCFNDGVTRKLDVLELLGIKSSGNTANSLVQIDKERIRKADIANLKCTKEARQKRRGTKRRKEDQYDSDDAQYGAGKY